MTDQELTVLEALCNNQLCGERPDANLEFIQRAVPALIAEVRRLREELKVSRETLTIAYMSGRYDGRKK